MNTAAASADWLLRQARNPFAVEPHTALTRPGNLIFPANALYREDPAAAGGTAAHLPTGHVVWYGRHRRRILFTDPEGQPLHECEWSPDAHGTLRLTRARFQLDWGRWVGLKPNGLINATVLDLSRRPGWQRLTADDLRTMAAQALGVPPSEVRFFFDDDDMVIAPTGQATIRHRKDALYVLEDGTFAHARFMACMGAMHWERIDFLPVVELFQSLLPGTGSAAFELIRALYDDQTADLPHPRPLHYRGLPPYPSAAAFRLFSAFFVPIGPGGRPPFPVFMEAARSHEVTWLPAPDPPRRYLTASPRLGITVKGRRLYKVIDADDPAGLPYPQVSPGQLAPCERAATVQGSTLILHEGKHDRHVPIRPAWGPLEETPAPDPSPVSFSWRDLFGNAAPQVRPAEAFAAVLLYPEDETEIDERSAQPFVADYLQDFLEEPSALSRSVTRARRILVHRFDAAVHTLVVLDRPAEYVIAYRDAAFAQKQAQGLWNAAASLQRDDIKHRLRFLPMEAGPDALGDPYEVVYAFLSFACFDQQEALRAELEALSRLLKAGGIVFVVGPPALEAAVGGWAQVVQREWVESLPTFRMHRTILPKARLKPGLMLYHLVKP